MEPTKCGQDALDLYRIHVNRKFGTDLRASHDLHRFSVTRPHEFWIDVWSYVGVAPDLPGDIRQAYDASLPMSSIPLFFEGVRLNYAENVLEGRDPDAIAVVGLREGEPLAGHLMTWGELRENVRKI